MKNIFIIIVVAVLSSLTLVANAQITEDLPTLDPAVTETIQAYGAVAGGVPHHVKYKEGDGVANKRRLVSYNIGLSAGMGQDGVVGMITQKVELRWFSLHVDAGVQQLEMDFETGSPSKCNSFTAGAYAMVDIMKIANAKSPFMLSFGIGGRYDNYKFDRINTYESVVDGQNVIVSDPIKHTGNPIDLAWKAEAGYRFGKKIEAFASYTGTKHDVIDTHSEGGKFNMSINQVQVGFRLKF